MTTDRELLEMAAKAAGIRVGYWLGEEMQIHFFSPDPDESMEIEWNPLTDDGDALRLAVKLGMVVEVDTTDEITRIRDFDYGEVLLVNMHFACDPYAATRRAIVRAAAEIGRSMK